MGEAPLPFGRHFGDFQRLGGFGNGHADEEAKFHQFRLFRIVEGELFEGVIHCQEDVRLRFDGELNVFDRDAFKFAASAFMAALGASSVDEDAPHCFCGGGKVMATAVPFHVGVIEEPEVGLVDQSGGLEGLAGLLLSHSG